MNGTDHLLSSRVYDDFPPYYIAFSKSSYEESSRIFFDCPEDVTTTEADYLVESTERHANYLEEYTYRNVFYVSKASRTSYKFIFLSAIVYLYLFI